MTSIPHELPRAGGAPGFAPVRMATSVLRHAVPLAPLYLLGGNTVSYLLLTAFDLSLGLAVIAELAPDRKKVPTIPSRLPWIFRVPSVTLFFATMAAIITLPIAMPVVIFGLMTGVHWTAILSGKGLWISAGTMAILAATHALSTEARRSRSAVAMRSSESDSGGDSAEQSSAGSQAAVAAQMTLIATFVLLAYLMVQFGRFILYAMPPLYASVLVFYDVRPDLAHRLFPDFWRTRVSKPNRATRLP